MQFVAGFAIIMALLANFFPEAGVDKKTSVFNSGSRREIRLTQAISPYSEEKFRNIVKQEHDYSCGSAALGTLLNFYVNERLSEKQIIRGLMEFGDKEQIKKLRAFSLWDMQQFLDAIGYKSGGYKANIKDLKNKEYWPCLIPIKVFNYKHFVVFKGIYNGHVFLADPFMGNSSYPLDKFMKIWDDNVMFIVWADKSKTVDALKLSRKDLRYIDEELQDTLMTHRLDIDNKTEDYRINDLDKWKKYKR